jgi:hypothetical protein
MSHILNIQKILGCTIEHAKKVFDEMCATGFDFSESSAKKLKKEVIICNQLVKA